MDLRETDAKTFVLVHGAWHGGWCWRRVADRLTARGHKVFAPTLTGLGERSHLLNANVRLATHIADIVNLFRWESLSKVALVGHSYGGVIISGVVEQIEAAVSSLTFLDALVPDNGQAHADLTMPGVRDSIAAAARSGELTVKPVAASVFKVNEKDQAWVDSVCTPHPRAAMTDRLTLTGARERIARKTYIRAKAYPSERYDNYQARLSATPGWAVHELPCGHDAMVDMPSELTELLLAAA